MKLAGLLKDCSLLAIVASVLLPLSAHAQGLVIAPYPTERPTIIAHFQATDFDYDFGYRFPSGSLELSGFYPLDSRLFALAGIPLAVYSAVHYDDTMSWSTGTIMLGNISAGIGWRSRLSHRSIMAHSLVVLTNTAPNIDDPSSERYWAYYAGWYSDPYRSERVSLNYWTIMANSQFALGDRPGISINWELRPQWSVPDGRWGHSQFWLNGGLTIGYGFSRLRLVTEYILSTWISGDGDQVSARSRTYDALGLGLSVEFQTVTPTLYYQRALDKFKRTIVDGTWGVRLDFPILSKQIR